MPTARPEKPTTSASVARSAVADCQSAIERTGGVLTGTYPPSYLDRLRAEWPD